MTVVDEGTLRLWSTRNLIVAKWSDAPTVRQLRALEKFGRDVGKQYPKGTALFNLALSGTPNFSSEVSRETARVSALPDIFPLATAHIVLVTGLVGAAIRAFLSTSLLIARPTRPTRVFGDKRAAAAWVRQGMQASGQRWSDAELVAAIDEN